TAVEGADRQRDLKRLDQESHADGRPARGDGEADPGFMQLPHGGARGLGQTLVLGQQRAVDIGHHERNAGHAGLDFSCRTILSTIVSADASIDTVSGRSSGAGGSSVSNWLVSRPGGMK